MTDVRPAAAPSAPSVKVAATALRGLVGSCHPLPTAAVTAVSACLATGVGLSGSRTVLLAAAVFTGQLSIGWSNDRIDMARDRAVGRTDKPTATGGVPAGVTAIAAGSALLATILLSGTLGPAAAAAALTLVAAGWTYNLGLKATAWSAATYLVGFGALAAVPYLALPRNPLPPWWAPVVGALLGVAAHCANVLPDLLADQVTGIRGLPQRLGARHSVTLMAVALAAASIVLGFGPARSTMQAVAVAAVGIAAAAFAAAVAARRPKSPAAFRIVLGVALLDVVLLIAVAG